MLTPTLLALTLLPICPGSECRGWQTGEQAASSEAAPAQTKIVGTLRGADGRALDGIAIDLQGRDPGYSYFNGRPSIDERLRTDGEGRFDTSVTLDPNLRYVLRWKGDGIVAGSSGWLKAEDLSTHLSLFAVARRPFHGRLLRSDGSPIAGAEVRIRRQGESTTTNASGEFRLAHLAETVEPVLFREPDGRTGWKLLKASDAWENVDLENRGAKKRGHTTPSLKNLSEEERAAFAKRLRFEWLDTAIEAGDYIDVRWRLLDCAKIDLEATLRRLRVRRVDSLLAQASIHHFNDRSTCGVRTCYDENVKEGADLRAFVEAQLRLAADTKCDQARAAYEAYVNEPPRAWLVRLRLGYGLGAGDAPKLTPVERARRNAAEAPAKPKYIQVQTYCRSALALLEAGHDVEAKEVMERARAIVAPGETPSFLSDPYIFALSAFDLDAALELIRAKTDVRKRFTAFMTVAVRLATTSPGKALELVKEAEAVPKHRYSRRRQRGGLQQTIYEISATHFEEAEGLASQFDWSGYSFGLLALSISRGKAPIPMDDRSREIERLLTKGYARAQGETSRQHRDRALVSLLAVAMEIDGTARDRWIGETLWQTTKCSARDEPEPVLAWTLRDADPDLGHALAFDAASAAMCTKTFFNESWNVATWFDPERSVALALQDGGDGLDNTARALERDPAEDVLSSPTCVGFYWPKD